jgi:hypothetical protein
MVEFGVNSTVNVCIEYTLKNGVIRTRFYDVNIYSEAGQMLKPYLSSFAYVTGFREEDIPSVAKAITNFYTDGFYPDNSDYDAIMENLDFEEMLRCIDADCAAGTMAQHTNYHVEQEAFGQTENVWRTSIQLDLNYDWPTGLGYSINYKHINVYEDSVHTLRWLEENGLFDPNNPENYKYGG